MTGLNSLNNFYQSVKLNYPMLSVLMSHDIITVALNASSTDKATGQASADSLRERAEELPEPLRGVLENALAELGYS